MHKNRKRILFSAVTAGVLVLVLIVNLLVNALFDSKLWFVDNTVTKYTDDFYTDDGLPPAALYTLQDSTKELLAEHAIPMVQKVNEERRANGDEPIKINIKLCDDRDVWNSKDSYRYILYTALSLQNQFPNEIDVSFINVKADPSLAQPYKVTSASTVYSSDVIVEFGTEYRVSSGTAFFTRNEENVLWAYSGEKTFCSYILSVTRAESPICCITTNHGEQIQKIPEFIKLIERSGYIVQYIDFEKDEIPADCRIILTYDPQTDFKAYGNLGETGKSEIEKLDKYLDGAFTYMLFVDNQTPSLTNLEEYLEEWGISISRADGQNYTVRDADKHVDKDGYAPIADYATAGTGASLTTDMRSAIYPSKVVFPNATAIKYAPNYKSAHVDANEATGSAAYDYGTYYKNSISRKMFDVFTASASAVAEIDGKTYEISTADNSFKLMTLTSETRLKQESSYDTTGLNVPSYVAVYSSTEMVSDELLTSASYGNADLMQACLRALGREVIPVDIDFKAFISTEIDSAAYTQGTAIAAMVWLALIPAAICFGLGIYVNVKRKYM